MKTYPTYLTFEPKALVANKAEQKQAKPKIGQPIPPPYYILPLSYNQGSEENPVFGEFELELCEFTNSMGILSKPSMSDPTRMEESILIKFDPSNQEHMKTRETINAMHKRAAELIGQNKYVVKKSAFDPAHPESGGFKNPIYTPIDDLGQPVIGKSQSMFLKLFSRGSGIMKEQTLFCDGDNKPIDKKLLTGVELTFIPLLHIKWVHIGTGISLQIELKSAAVTDIKERNTESKQSSTIHSLSETRPEYRAKLAGQLAKISLNRQSLLLPPPTSQPTNEKVEENTSTLSGITATDNVPINDPPVVSHTPRKEYKIPLVDN